MHRFGEFNLKTIAPNGKPAQIRLGRDCDIEIPHESDDYDCEQANDLPHERYRARTGTQRNIGVDRCQNRQLTRERDE